MTHITVIPPSSPPAHSNAAWNLAPHLESEITSLAAICEVKQPQRQPLNTLEEDEGDEESDDNEESEDVGPLTNCTASLAPSDNKDGMKRRFLDTLAEILCYKKYAMYVTCTSLQEWNSRAIITVARNAKWEKRDTDLLTDLVTLMEGLAAGEPLQGVQASSLLRRLSVYYAPRLRYHVKQLLHLVQGKDKVKAFIPFCDEFLSQRITPVELVLRIERIHHDTDLYSAVRETYPPKVLERLVGELYFIRRPFIAQKIFCAAASRLESFQAVTFKLLEGFEEKAVPPDHSTCARFPVAPRSRGKLESTLQKSKWVHAEMRMVFYILGCDNMSRQFPYLGISKKTCFSCGHILQSLDIFSTRANHGKVYPRWTLPSTAAVSQDSLDSLHRATRGLADALCTEAAIDRGIHMDAVKESTITTPVAPVRIAWSPFNTVPPDSRFAAREAGFLRAIMGSGHMSDTNNSHHSSTEDESPSYTETELSQADITKPAAPQCAHCHENSRSLTACSKCDSIFYCDSDCREAHWPKHKFTCRLGRPIDEADMLVLACQEDQVQIDEDVALAFGFRSFSSARNWQILSHIYTKLIMKYGVNDDELRRAWQTNSLREFLLHRCAQLPRHDVAAEIAWIKSHEELAANAILGFDKVMESMKRQLLDPHDWNTAFPDLVPRAKLDAFVFFCQILNGHIPDADEDNWISLGFCTTADEAALQTLSRLYAKLIRECKFQEFWKAMEASKMVQLFEKYRLGRGISRLRNFKTLMCDIGKWYESVWELKRFTRISGADPMQAVVADYGFGHCATGQQQEHLRQIYRSYFSRGEDEMDLHRACIEGRLYYFLESVLGPLDIQPGLLSNEYPLECGDHMGMVVEVAILCPESAVEQVEELRRRRGEEGVVLTIPDESGLDMQYCLRQRAGFLGEPINRRITRIGNTLITQWSTR